MSVNFIAQGVEIVKTAIDADNRAEYAQAYQLYQKSLDYFVTGLKCTLARARAHCGLTWLSLHADEKNESSKAIVLQRVEGYMKRAEELKKMLEGRPAPRAAAAAGASAARLQVAPHGACMRVGAARQRRAAAAAAAAQRPQVVVAVVAVLRRTVMIQRRRSYAPPWQARACAALVPCARPRWRWWFGRAPLNDRGGPADTGAVVSDRPNVKWDDVAVRAPCARRRVVCGAALNSREARACLNSGARGGQGGAQGSRYPTSAVSGALLRCVCGGT